LDCQSQSNPLNRIAIRIEQSSNPIQQYPAYSNISDDEVKKIKMIFLLQE
jgi:hypothetical protein